MTTLRRSLTLLWPLALALAVLVTSCTPDAGEAAPKGANAAKPAAPAAPAAPATTSADPCGDLKSLVCLALGERSEACYAYTVTTATLPAPACAAAVGQADAVVKALKAQRAACQELETKLCADVGPETDTCAQVKEQTPEIPNDKCKEMMEHYADVLDSLKAMEARNKPLAPEAVARLTAGAAPSFGPADAKVTIVAFSDFQCPYCAEAGKVTSALHEKYKDKVRFVFRHFPLPFHPNALRAAQASLAAEVQGKFWAFHDLMFANQEKLDRDGLLALAKQAGLNPDALAKALDAGTHKAAVEADIALGKDVNVEGTPTFYLNGALVPNPTDLDAVAAQIDAALAK